MRHHPDAGWLYMHWKMPAGTGTKEERLSALTGKYAGHRYFFPAVAGLPGELHPLMAWWAVLYALSMLARYQPAISPPSGPTTSTWTAADTRCPSRRFWNGPWNT